MKYKYTIEQLKEWFEYDSNTGNVYGLNFGRSRKRKLLKRINQDGYHGANKTINGKQLSILIHRVAYELYHNELLGSNIIDHIDHNKLNNKIDNLRKVDRATNNRNLGLKKNNKYNCHNIEKTSSGKYRARITICGQRIHLGTFVDLQDAIEAKQKANAKYGFHENHK